MLQKFSKINTVDGILNLPGDKSISHRVVMFSSLADGISRIENLSDAEDVNSTISCFRQLGCSIERNDKEIIVRGKGFKGFAKPDELYAGNSGTTSRLISGILASQQFESVITGDESLSKRPMKRIMEPLMSMGARLVSTADYTLPIRILPSDNLHAIDYLLPVASAQVKSCILLAGLHLEEKTSITELVPTRDHTENLLSLKVENNNGKRKIFVSRADYPGPNDYFVPSDISTAAFFIILALLTKNAKLVIRNISLNKTRTGIVDVLRMMGAEIVEDNVKMKMGETYGDLVISGGSLKNTDIPAELIPNIIDEIPILSVAGLLSEGAFRISHAKELRYKETDRIDALCKNYRLLGLDVSETEDGFEIGGSIKNKNIVFESYGDHRIAMAFGVLSSLLPSGGAVENFECVNISNPDFITQLNKVSQG